MSFPHHTRVGVMRGGPSHEYDVSLKTGSAILSNLPEDCTPIDILISKDGVWHSNGFEKSPAQILHGVDIVINGLHGSFGEDGTVQKILDQFGVPYTGSSSIPSALAMNKKLTKDALSNHSIKTPPAIVVARTTNEPTPTLFELKQISELIYHSLPFPLIIKPVGLGSSIGVSYVAGKQDLTPALKHSFSYSPQLLVEEFIDGVEVTCGVIEDFRGNSLYTLLPVSIHKADNARFHDYDTKYNIQGVSHTIPAILSSIQKMQIEELARQVHSHLHLRDYSRTDMIIHPRRGVFVLEVNTLPEITHRSTFIKSLEALGGSMKEFLSHLVDRTLKRK